MRSLSFRSQLLLLMLTPVLVTTLVLTLFVIPAVYLRYGFVPHVDDSADDLFTDLPEPTSARG